MLLLLLLSVVRAVHQPSLHMRKEEVGGEEGELSFRLPREAPWPVHGDGEGSVAQYSSHFQHPESVAPVIPDTHSCAFQMCVCERR